MSAMPAASDALPDITVTIQVDGKGEVVIGSAVYPIAEDGIESARMAATAMVCAQVAQPAGRPVRVTTWDPKGTGEVLVYPDGTAHYTTPSANGALLGSPADGSGAYGAPAPPPELPTGGARSGQGYLGRHSRTSFITTDSGDEPATMGLRGALTRSGMRTRPSRRELSLRDDIRLVSQHWLGPRTVAVANPKGSANKTPTTLCLSAVFGRYGGGGVLAWDNNETRGTAAWRTRQGPHDATVLDLLPRTGDLLAAGSQAAELAGHVHHQPGDKFDVLWSDQSTEGEHEVTGAEVDAIHEVASKYYRLVVMDSGNSERASNWRAMIRHAHSLVVPATNVEDTAEAGARMLEALAQRDEHSADLARNAVAIISQRTSGNDSNLRRIVRGFEPLVRTVVTIPHDPALYTGVIRFDALRPATQRAWLSAAAAVAEAL
jgi:MinD-like ATPase involved in chromosome partitioning or flagellar assembly